MSVAFIISIIVPEAEMYEQKDTLVLCKYLKNKEFDSLTIENMVHIFSIANAFFENSPHK